MTMPMRSIAFAVLALNLACVRAPRGTAPESGESATTAVVVTPATDTRILVMGRHAVDGTSVRFGAAGVTFFMRFRGTALDAQLVREGTDSIAHDWFSAVVDGGEPRRFRVESGDRWYAVASGLSSGVHTVALSKATEGQNGHDRLVAVRAGALLRPDSLPSRRIEYIGNSITAGFGNDPRPVPCGQGTWYDPTHAWLAYGPRLARRLGAQCMLSAVSGIGMRRNWNSDAPVMPAVYDGVYMEYADTTTHWDFTRWTPDLVIIALGTNDFSDGGGPTPRPALDGEAFVRDYVRFVERVRGHYPRARVLLVDSPTQSPERDRQLDDYLDRVIDARAAVGDAAFGRFSWSGHYVAGCNGHPGLEEHAAMADELEPDVRHLMGW